MMVGSAMLLLVYMPHSGRDEEDYTWRAWGSWVRKKQLDYIMGPKDRRSTTWYLNKERFRTWNYFFVITRIEGRDLTRSVLRAAPDGRPSLEQTRLRSKNLRSTHEVTPPMPLHVMRRREGLVLLHDRLVSAAAEVKDTTTSSRNRNKFCIPKEIRKIAADAAGCRNPVRKNNCARSPVKHGGNLRREELCHPGRR